MSESDLKFREEVEVILEDINKYCKIAMRTIHTTTEEQLRKDTIYVCSKLLPEILNMVRILVMRNSEVTATNQVILDLLEKYREEIETKEN